MQQPQHRMQGIAQSHSVGSQRSHSTLLESKGKVTVSTECVPQLLCGKLSAIYKCEYPTRGVGVRGWSRKVFSNISAECASGSHTAVCMKCGSLQFGSDESTTTMTSLTCIVKSPAWLATYSNIGPVVGNETSKLLDLLYSIYST